MNDTPTLQTGRTILKISGRWDDHVLTALVHSDQVTDTSQNPMSIDKHEV